MPSQALFSPTRIVLRAYRLLRVDRLASTRLGERLFVAAFFAYKRWLEDPHAAFAQRHPEVFANGHVLDVGANVGYTASVFARFVSPGFRVYAFEPDEVNFARLQRVTQNSEVVAIRSAVGDVDGRALLLRNPDHPGDHRIINTADAQAAEVGIVRLDTFAAANAVAPVKFVKIDVQGHELAVCRGMARLVEENAALEISFEYSGAESDAVIEFFRERRFRVYLMRRNGSVAPLTGTVLEDAWMARGYCDLLATRRNLG